MVNGENPIAESIVFTIQWVSPMVSAASRKLWMAKGAVKFVRVCLL